MRSTSNLWRLKNVFLNPDLNVVISKITVVIFITEINDWLTTDSDDMTVPWGCFVLYKAPVTSLLNYPLPFSRLNTANSNRPHRTYRLIPLTVDSLKVANLMATVSSDPVYENLIIDGAISAEPVELSSIPEYSAIILYVSYSRIVPH